MIAPPFRPVLAWALGILCVTSVPGASIPRGTTFPGLDKVIHGAMYFGLGRAAIRAAGSAPWKVLAAVGTFAALDEAHQEWIPGRSGDVGDWVADVAGATLGIAGFRARGRQELVRES
ncbi:MAG: VanZ family protein [Gemmatimonadetes bacterium]|nr:VanZ family protein [Gemmatimonadota bacterium]